jgi:hypothetical protein
MHPPAIRKANTVLESYSDEQHRELDHKVTLIVIERCEKYGLMPIDITTNVIQRQSCFIQAMFRRV